jgi:hypothetical protein
MFSSKFVIKIQPILNQLSPETVLFAEKGDYCTEALSCSAEKYSFSPPYSLQQLTPLPQIDVAIISGLTETMAKIDAQQWLGFLKNRYCQHIFILTNSKQGEAWALTDFLSLGFKRLSQIDDAELYYYAIESYQPKRDWLNAKYWANPENYDKYRW